MHHGSPEARLWAAVALTLINDCRDDLATTTSIENIGRAAEKWKGRAREPGFRMILEICDIPLCKVIKWIDAFEKRSKRALRQGYWDAEGAVLVSDQAVIGRGQKRAY